MLQRYPPTRLQRRALLTKMAVTCARAPQDILNHCFDDVERFMARLQQAAEAQSVLNQRRKKRSRKTKKEKEGQNGEMLKLCVN